MKKLFFPMLLLHGIFALAITLVALSMGSGVSASLFLGAGFTLVIAPALCLAKLLHLGHFQLGIFCAFWTTLLLYVPSLSADFSYTADGTLIYDKGIPDSIFLAKFVTSVVSTTIISSMVSSKIYLEPVQLDS